MRGNEIGWTSFEVMTCLAASLVLILCFVGWMRGAAEPLVPPRLFRSKGFSGGLVAAFFQYGALYATLFFVTQFLQVAQGYGPLDAGLRLLPWTATLFVVAPISGSLVNRVGERVLVSTGLALNAAGLLWLGLAATISMSFTTMAPALVVMGIGVSLALPSLQSGVLRNVQPADIGKASGAFSMSQFIGGMFGIAITACVFSAFGSFASPEAFTDGFRALIFAAAVMVAIGSLCGLTLSGGVSRTAAPQPAAV